MNQAVLPGVVAPPAKLLGMSRRAAPGKPSEEESALLERALSSGERGLEELLRRLLPTVRGTAVRALGPGHRDLEDCIQESLLGIVRALPAFRGESSLTHYARRITLRRCLDYIKRSRTEKRTMDQQFGEDPGLLPDRPRQLEEAHRAELRFAFTELLTLLPSEQAEAFACRHLFGYSVEEIGSLSSTSPNTIRSRLRLAKEALLARIKGDPRLTLLLGGTQ